MHPAPTLEMHSSPIQAPPVQAPPVQAPPIQAVVPLPAAPAAVGQAVGPSSPGHAVPFWRKHWKLLLACLLLLSLIGGAVLAFASDYVK